MANLRFIISLITKENDYQVEQAAAAQAAAPKVGADAQILYADNDAITQSTQLLKAIQSDAAMRPHALCAVHPGAVGNFGGAGSHGRHADDGAAQRANYFAAGALDGGKRAARGGIMAAIEYFEQSAD